MILDHRTGLHSHGKASARSQNLILQFHSEKILHPVLRSQAELRLIYFFVLSKWFWTAASACGFELAAGCVAEGRELIKNYVGVVREGALTQLGYF